MENAERLGFESTPKRYVIYSDERGVYLGFLCWSKREPEVSAKTTSAPTYSGEEGTALMAPGGPTAHPGVLLCMVIPDLPDGRIKKESLPNFLLPTW